MRISYSTPTSNCFDDLRDRLETLLKQPRKLSILDVGGGRHPFLPESAIKEHGHQYAILELSYEELLQAPQYVRKIECDISGDLSKARELGSDGTPTLAGQFDLVFSVMVAEHIADPAAMHRNIWKLLAPGGDAVHLFPTMFSIPFVINKFLPERISWTLNYLFSPKGRRSRAKFPAYYRWCFGPRRPAIRRFQSLGWEIIEYRGYFGHAYYKRFPGLRQLHKWKSDLLERHPHPFFSNYALLWLRKPNVHEKGKGMVTSPAS